MNKLLLLLLIFITSTIISAQDIQSKWISTPLIIDGDTSDWIERPSRFDSNTKILYEFRNDSENLYMIFEIIDNMSQMKFMNAGFQVNINVKSKPKLNASIDFLPQERDRVEPNFNSPNNIENMQQGYLVKASFAEVKGFLKTTELIKRNSNLNENFTFNMGWTDNNHMMIEIKIPLSELFVSSDNIENLTRLPIQIICKLHALERPSTKNMQDNIGMHGNMSPGGGHGGGMPGGDGRGMSHGGNHTNDAGRNPQEMQTIFNEQSFKAKIFLSKKN